MENTEKNERTVEIFDSTLRDGAQGEGISFSVQDKLNIVKTLDELGISYIEAGNPGSNPKDLEFFQEVKKIKLQNARLVAFGATRRKDISVESDLLGAAIALCGKQPGMVAILGTGAATCYYNGESIDQKVPSLGFVLGDEGSGARIGAHFLADYLRGGMPESLRAEFASLCPLPLHEIIETVYHGRDTGRFLGEFATFAADRYQNEYVRSVLKDEFGRFFQKQVLPYGASVHENGIHILGSTAFHAESILRETAHECHIPIGKILKAPMDGLAAYYKPQVQDLLKKADPEEGI